jgi:hypothetical protein
MAAAEKSELVADRFRSFLQKGLEMADKRGVWAPDAASPVKEG